MHDAATSTKTATILDALSSGIFCVNLSETKGMHAWLAARYFLFDRCSDFQQQFTRARDSFDQAAIHDLRVSSRRLRECLFIFADCFRKRPFSRISKELKSLTVMLGQIRNTDEAILFFSPLVEQCASGSAALVMKVVAALQEKRVIEQRKLKRDLNKADPGSLPGKVDAICSNPSVFNPAVNALFQPVTTIILAAVAASEKTILTLLPAALIEEDVAAQHSLRIAIKKFRYRMEFMAPFASSDYKKVYSAVKGYQETLGHMHDLDLFKEMALCYASEAESDNPLYKIIVARRRMLFSEFIRLHEESPLDKMGDLIRGLL